jgi:hypothetical protein
VTRPEIQISDSTESLLLRRALGRACPEDYVDWAVDQLCRDIDGSNLRILAGLSVRFDRDDIESYFRLTCRDLGLVHFDTAVAPLAVARMIQRAHELGRICSEETVEMVAELYESSEYQEELLSPWYSMREELAWREGYFYSPAALESVDRAVSREWGLFDRATRLPLPDGWLRRSRCSACAHVGVSQVRGPSRVTRVLATLARRPALSRAVCERCRSERLTSLGDPDARSAYLDELESKGT